MWPVKYLSKEFWDLEQVDFIILNVSELHLEIRLNIVWRNTFVKSRVRKKSCARNTLVGSIAAIFYCYMFRLGAKVRNVYVSGEK